MAHWGGCRAENKQTVINKAVCSAEHGNVLYNVLDKMISISYKMGKKGTARSTIPCTTRPSAPSLVVTEYNTVHHETICSKSRGY